MRKIAVMEDFLTKAHMEKLRAAAERLGFAVDFYPKNVLPDEKAGEYEVIYGNCDPGLGFATQTIIGGDGRSASIAAASILAKVARDRYMKELDQKYPEYRFAQHKGYGTRLHYEML